MVTFAIRTAHGYLSLQPGGQIEYRPAPGAWETFVLEPLTEFIVGTPVLPLSNCPRWASAWSESPSSSTT